MYCRGCHADLQLERADVRIRDSTFDITGGEAEVGPLIVAPFLYSWAVCGGVPAATTEKAVVFPVMALWVAGCVVVEGTVVVATAAIVIVASEVEELLTTEMESEALPVEAGVNLPVMGVRCPAPMELNPTQPE
jgi:hypothetical protein